MQTTENNDLSDAKPPVAALPAKIAANYCGISTTSIYYEMKRGNLRGFKYGAKRLFLVSELDAWLAAVSAKAA